MDLIFDKYLEQAYDLEPSNDLDSIGQLLLIGAIKELQMVFRFEKDIFALKEALRDRQVDLIRLRKAEFHFSDRLIIMEKLLNDLIEAIGGI